MPSPTSKPVLHLVIDHDPDSYSKWEIGSLQLDSGKVVRFGPDNDYASATPRIHSLSCLIVHQEYLRRIGQVYSKLSPERHQHLKTLWEATKRETPKWQLDLFRKNPVPDFIQSEGGRKHFDVWFTDQIELRIETTFSTDELPTKALLDLRNFLTTPSKNSEPKLVFEILRVGSPISSEELEGMLGYGDEIQVRTRTNFSGELLLLWISGSKSVHELYPNLDIAIDQNATPDDFQKLKEGFEVTVPGNDTVRVDSLSGVESCLALLKNKRFENAEISLIKESVSETLSNRNKTARLFRPDFKEIPISSEPLTAPADKGRESAFRLEPSIKLSAWESQLKEVLTGSAKRVYLFHIPIK